MVWQRLSGSHVALAVEAQQALAGASVLEVGGPSRIFSRSGLVPVYEAPDRIDNVNYTGSTLWEAGLVDGGDYRAGGSDPRGTQWLAEAGNLTRVKDGTYDAVLSSHTLEHLANPLGALEEWARVVRPGGHLLLVLPHRDGTFDHRRPVTSLEHLVADRACSRPEDDTTHVNEVLELHDLRRDPDMASREALLDAVARNAETRAMHHHVFDVRTALDAVSASGWRAVAAEATRPHHIVIWAQKGPAGPHPAFTSPFGSDA